MNSNLHTGDPLPLLKVDRLTVSYPVRTGILRPALELVALDDVSFELRPGETLGVVGESGCGKSTLARAVLHLVGPRAGQVSWLGRSLDTLARDELRQLCADRQVVFQDPFASLDPRMTVLEIVAEPLREFRPAFDRGDREREVSAMLERVGLSGDLLHRYPHEFSGGQCQRIGIARALILNPRLLVCDEPLSALDVSIQAQIVNLLMRLQRELGLSVLFISHNLAVVRHLCQRILVLYLGRVMELAPRAALFELALHPYTQALLAAIPRPDPRFERSRAGASLGGEIPSPLEPPSGCVFRTRCRWADQRCADAAPPLERAQDDQWVACWRWRELKVQSDAHVLRTGE